MTADAVLMALHKQIDADVAPYLRLALARGEALRIGMYVDTDAEVGAPDIKPIFKRDDNVAKKRAPA